MGTNVNTLLATLHHTKFTLGNDPEQDPDREPEPPTKIADKPVQRSGKRNVLDQAQAAPARGDSSERGRGGRRGRGGHEGTSNMAVWASLARTESAVLLGDAAVRRTSANCTSQQSSL